MKKKILSLITVWAMICTFIGIMPTFSVSAICCRKDGFDKSRYTLTGNMAQDVATIAKSQKGRTCTQFGYSGVDYGQWCDEFVADCIENAGGDSSIVGHGGTVSDFKNVMERKGAKPVNEPRTGDLIFFTKGHVEIVTKVENGVVYCAGGNNGSHPGSCAGERRASYVGTVSGYLRPNYSGGSVTPPANDDELGISYPRPSGNPLLSTGSTGSGVSWLQTALNKANNAGLAVDGQFGSGTKQAVINFQKANGLDADGIAGPATINKLVEVIKNKNNPQPSVKAKSKIWMSDSKMGNEVSSFEAGKWYYMCYKFYDEYSGKLLSEIASLKDFKVTETIYNPDGSVFNTCTYENSDNNWIGIRPTITGRYKWELTLTVTSPATVSGEFNVSCNHSYGSWTTVKSATCASEGSEKRTCSVCGNSETRAVPATGHSYNSKIIPPTNTEKGYTLHTCSKCGSSYKDNFTDMLVFEFIASENSVNINIDKNEKKSITFSYKNVPSSIEYVNVQIDRGDNPVVNLEWGKWENHAIPLYFSGYRTGTENVTVKLYDVGTKEVLASKTIKVTVSECNHNFSSWSTTKEPTCTSNGIKSRKCTVCGKTETESIPATGHSWSEWKTVKEATCIEKGESIRKCSTCRAEEGAPIISTMHKYESTVIAPTYAESGYTLHTCSVCGYSYKDTYTDTYTEKLTSTVTLTCNNITALPGETIEIKLYADSHGVPIEGFDIGINFDESNMELADINTDSYDFGVATNINNGIGVAVCYYPYEKGDGWILTPEKPIVTYTFKLSENASPGDYDININPPEFYSYGNLTKINLNNLKGTITVAENSKTELQGDLNADNELSVSDVVLLQKYLVKKTRLSSILWNLADMNNDGQVNVFDVVILKRKILYGE